MGFSDIDESGLPPNLRKVLSSVRTATPVNAVAASKALTFTGDGLDTETTSINGVVFEFMTGSTITAGNVTVDVSGGAGLTASAAALVAAIIDTPSCGVTATNTGGVLTATALTKGTAGNAIVLAETNTNGAWAGGAVLLSGGVNGTVGRKNNLAGDSSYLYLAIADNTIADANWRRFTVGSVY